MILLLAVIAGFLLGLARCQIRGQPYRPAHLANTWLVVLATLPQVLVFYYLPTARIAPEWLIRPCLVCSQVALLIFVGLNLDRPGFWILGAGLVFNLLVIIANGGLMPISPEVATQLIPGQSPALWEAGQRFAWSKDVVLARSITYLWWLSDRFLLPAWFPWRVAFSFGDVLIALGVFWFLWEAGGKAQKDTSKAKENVGHLFKQGDYL